MVNFISFIQAATLNDILFVLMQLTLVVCVIYSLYERHLKSRVAHAITDAKTHTKRAIQRTSLIIKKMKNRKLKPKSGSHTIIVADSVMTTSIVGTARISVNRGEASWDYFALGWTVLSVFIIEANGLYNSQLTTNYSIGILIVDLCLITYLCFLSSWFRNKLMSIVVWRNRTPD